MDCDLSAMIDALLAIDGGADPRVVFRRAGRTKPNKRDEQLVRAIASGARRHATSTTTGRPSAPRSQRCRARYYG